MKTLEQCDMMRNLVAKYGRNKDIVCREYALAEHRGFVERRSNKNQMSADQYASRLWRNGVRREWF